MNLITNLFNTIATYPIFNTLMELYHLLGDLGLSIVVLTVTIFLATFPFTWKQLKTAQATQALQPQLAEIKRRHANDPLAQAEERRALYKEHGISSSFSLGSLLLQGTVLSGLFFALNSILPHSTLSTLNRVMYPFFVHFSALPDLNLTWFTALNALWHISLGYPDPTHILPLLAGLLTFMQMRMAQPITQTGQTIMQATQAIQFLLLLLSIGLTIFFAWQFAASVAVSRLVWLVLSMIQRYFVTGWGSLWVMPSFALSGVGNPARARLDVSTQQIPRLSSKRTRRHHSSRSSAHHRGKKPRRR